MRSDWVTSTATDTQRNITITLYSGGAWGALIDGTIVGGTDLSPYITRISQGPSECRFSAAWNTALDSIPVAGDLIQIKDGSQVLFNGAVEQVDERREQRGARTMSVTIRSRDATPQWRMLNWATDMYPVGTDLGLIATDILTAMGLATFEFPTVAVMGRNTPHASMQLAGVTAWQMLKTILLPVGLEPFVDAVGRFKPISRDVTRPADLTLSQGQVKSIAGSKSKPPVTNVTVKWLDRVLSKSVQQEQKLASASVTTGYFTHQTVRQLYWSEDRRQRAEDTRLVTLESANAGIVPVTSEVYQQNSETMGTLTLTTSYFIPLIVTASIATHLHYNKVKDVKPGDSPLIDPVGRAPQAIAASGMLFAMMHIGTGSYEVWGKPFDWVHAMNKTEAYDDAALIHRRNELEIETDFIYDESHASEVATSELIYGARAGQNYSVVIVDNPAIERGDILSLPGDSRLYVTDYSRDLTRGTDALLKVSGFRV